MPKFIRRKSQLNTFNRPRPKNRPKKKLELTEDKVSGQVNPTIPNNSATTQTSLESEKINRLMDDAIDRLNHTQTKINVGSFTPDPEEYNGISSDQEGYKLLHHEISSEQRRAQELEERLKIIQLDYEQEKAKLTDTINELKRELHRTKPLHDNALFTLTRELRDTVKEMESFNSPDQSVIPTNEINPIPTPIMPPAPTTPETFTPKTVTKSQTPQAKTETAATEPAKPIEAPAKKKKLLTTATASIAVLVFLAGLAAYSLMKKPTVDQKLVEEYLNKNSSGEVAGASTQAQSSNNNSPLPTQPPAQTTMDLKKLEADIPFEQTIWDTLKDPNFGVKLQYPSNTAEILKTDSNITFLRKDGYIFKIQRIETALNPDEYWRQVKATSLNYKDNKTKFLNREALFLEIDDVTDYPGNRYLVKNGNFLYDIWYATSGSAFSTDDIRRAKYMLDTVSFDSG